VPQDPAVESIEAAGKEIFDLAELGIEPSLAFALARCLC